jgi:hypothetical protein
MKPVNYNKVTSITFKALEEVVGSGLITAQKEDLEKYGRDETEDLLF